MEPVPKIRASFSFKVVVWDASISFITVLLAGQVAALFVGEQFSWWRIRVIFSLQGDVWLSNDNVFPCFVWKDPHHVYFFFVCQTIQDKKKCVTDNKQHRFWGLNYRDNATFNAKNSSLSNIHCYLKQSLFQSHRLMLKMQHKETLEREGRLWDFGPWVMRY